MQKEIGVVDSGGPGPWSHLLATRQTAAGPRPAEADRLPKAEIAGRPPSQRLGVAGRRSRRCRGTEKNGKRIGLVFFVAKWPDK